MWWMGKFMLAVLVVFGVSFLFDWYVPVWEWIIGISFLNYFAFTAFVNPYYDSVHPPTMFEGKKEEDQEQRKVPELPPPIQTLT